MFYPLLPIDYLACYVCVPQGAIQGPGEFAEGLVLGVRSLFGHTVGGAAGAVSRITGAMGQYNCEHKT